jgi:hypothetical protein
MEPVREPVLTHLLAKKFLKDSQTPKPTAFNTIMRYSGAFGCTRQMAYDYFEAEPSNPTPVTGAWVMNLGTLIHEALQREIAAFDPLARFEEPSQVNQYISGHTDGLIDLKRWGWCLFELKTMGEFPFKKAMGYKGMFNSAQKVAAQGPSLSAITQAGMNALALEEKHGIRIELLIMGVITYEPVKQGAAEAMGIDDLDRFMGEFHIEREYWEPMARAEIERLTEAAVEIEEGYLPQRFARDDNGDEIRLYADSSNWRCDPAYCKYRDLCESDGEGLLHKKDSYLQIRSKSEA